MNSKQWFSSLAIVLASLAGGAAQAQIVNGSFETGTLTGWTTGVNNRVAVVQNSNFRVGANPAPMPAVPEGNYFAVLSTGPGAISGVGSTIDGNGTNDFDSSTLNGTISFTGRPAVLMFDWSFASSEPDANPPYDDIFDVRINNLRVFSGSVSGSTSNTSDFPDAPATGLGVVNWSINAGAVNGTTLTRGVGAWTRTCITVPYATTGSYNLPLVFRVADQADNTVDSVLLIDNVRVQEACDPNPAVVLSQFTNTTGSNVEAKGGGFVFRQADQRLVVANRDGSSTQVRAFVSSANHDGTNPNLLEQLYLRRNGVNERVNLTITAGGRIQGLDLSDDGLFLAFSARESATDNLEIYRVRLSNGLLTKVTTTTGCTNENPVVASGGGVLAFESTCGSLTGYGSTRKIVYMRMDNAGTVSTTTAIPAIPGCPAQDPSITTNGQYIGMSSSCNPPGRNNSNGYRELFVFQIASDQTGTSSRWRRVTTSGASALNYSLTLSQGGSGFANVYANFISTANLASNNSEGLAEIFRWQGNNTTSNNGTVVQVTNGPVAGADYYFTNVLRGVANSNAVYYSFERINALTGGIEVGYGLSSSAIPTVMVSGGNFLGLGFNETGTEVIVPFVAAEDFTGGNGDGNYEVWEARATK